MPTGSVLPHIRIKLFLIGDRGLWTMTGPDDGIGGELCKTLQTLRHFLPTASVKIGPSDAHAEKGVAGEGHVLVLTVVDTAARGVSRGM